MGTADERAEAAAGAVFGALADPTRRAVLRAVAEAGQATATEVGVKVGVSRQAAAKHLDLLAAAGLATDARAGRERRWRVTAAPLVDAASWLAATGQAWDRRLARLEAASRAPGPESAPRAPVRPTRREQRAQRTEAGGAGGDPPGPGRPARPSERRRPPVP